LFAKNVGKDENKFLEVEGTKSRKLSHLTGTNNRKEIWRKKSLEKIQKL
jgi:hypothetical protein